jgi:hypothetical protein
MKRYLSAFILLTLAAPLWAAPPSKIQANYEVSKGSIRVATMAETFTLQRDRYTLESVSEAVGMLSVFKPETIRVTSSGTVAEHGLRPNTYASERKLDTERNTRARFDWAKLQISLADRNGMRLQPLPAGTQDRLSAMYQLMFLPLQNMHVLKLSMTNGSKVDDYTFEITQGESVTVPLGTFRAIHLATPPEANSNRTEIWVDEEHHFPYKLVITEPDGGQFIQVLTSIEFTP